MTTAPQSEDPQMDGAIKTNFGVYVALIITCLGISLATNSIWIQVPILERTLTEVSLCTNVRTTL